VDEGDGRGLENIHRQRSAKSLHVEIVQGDCELATVMKDVMALTKVNFNGCMFADGMPVTLRFADAVGEILTAAPLQPGSPWAFKDYI
jgi:hypothetical protein